MQHLEIVNLSAAYGDKLVLDGFSMSVGKGEIVCLIGPSGSGKSTVLRTLIGLLPPKGGKVLLNGKQINYKDKKELREVRERFAIVFQQYNLFQNMSVLKNVTVGPVKVKKRNRTKVEEEARELLTKVGLSDKFNAYPDELSGGQQQRVAIARALALHPEILFLDEVTAALDPELVKEVLDTVRILAKDGMTMIIISHEMGFVREVASKVVLLDEGQAIECGTPEELFDNPKTQRAQDFVGKILRH